MAWILYTNERGKVRPSVLFQDTAAPVLTAHEKSAVFHKAEIKPSEAAALISRETSLDKLAKLYPLPPKLPEPAPQIIKLAAEASHD